LVCKLVKLTPQISLFFFIFFNLFIARKMLGLLKTSKIIKIICPWQILGVLIWSLHTIKCTKVDIKQSWIDQRLFVLLNSTSLKLNRLSKGF